MRTSHPVFRSLSPPICQLNTDVQGSSGRSRTGDGKDSVAEFLNERLHHRPDPAGVTSKLSCSPAGDLEFVAAISCMYYMSAYVPKRKSIYIIDYFMAYNQLVHYQLLSFHLIWFQFLRS